MSQLLRRTRTALAAVLLLPLALPSHRATGRIEGRVRDQAGAPIPHAYVTVVGTALAATADSLGRYALRDVSAGTVALQAAFVGYKPVRAEGIRVVAGRTTTHDFALERTVVQVSEVTVTGAAQPLVPRDEVTSKQRVNGRTTDKLPVDRVNQALALQPGVVASATSMDGVPTQRGSRGSGFVTVPEFNTEEYRRIDDNRFLAAATNPLSTVSIDVDRASYGNVRRFLAQGQRPPADAVRIEELINYFPYAYAEPRGEHPFTVQTDLAPAPWNPRHQLLRIGLQGRHIETASLPPSNLVFLIDVSGSMASPAKLPLVKQAFRLLVEQLRPQDRVAIVVYAGNAGLVLPSTPGSRKQAILDAIDRLEAGGSTAGGAGIQLAYDVARANFLRGGNNRVILATDGDFNVGVSSEGELSRLIEQRRREGTDLTVLGFGMGNYKDARMEQLADRGNGNYAYVDNLLEARKVLVSEIGATLVTIAKDVKLQIEFNPARVQAYRLIGYENRLLASEDFNDDTKDAGDLGAGHSVTALYELVPAGMPSDVAIAGVDSLRYQPSAAAPHGRVIPNEWLTVKLRYKDPQGGASRLLVHPVAAGAEARAVQGDFAWAAAVAAFGMVLRDSEYRGSATLEQVLTLARAARGTDPDGYRAEFIRLAEMARSLEGMRQVGQRE